MGLIFQDSTILYGEKSKNKPTKQQKIRPQNSFPMQKLLFLVDCDKYLKIIFLSQEQNSFEKPAFQNATMGVYIDYFFLELDFWALWVNPVSS